MRPSRTSSGSSSRSSIYLDLSQHHPNFTTAEEITSQTQHLLSTTTIMGSIDATSTPIAMQYHHQAQTTFSPPLIANENAFLGDVATSEKQDPKAPISCGFYRLEKGTPSILPPPSLMLTCIRHTTRIRIHLPRNEDHCRR